ncbi:CDP-diacylglycerol--glycerol-3-phosphate-3-phosphatidyltransferase [Candidatus Mycoplasma haemominutum 'Birmingham 1']|uniref:CDP-diacylglycerol--glycerol-3-phosphate-3-phosph atidyltransferase n=1 Tax=Candidatus Mycoplasma haematominutum 'Birmingham 1' TaxID=1116213 RepID=G8C357_9MOLU|nr:CDP-alcohol phosphatidyltransferase family protein [Candidatus Mycoplasma haematominutum]CCE66755.1 CDP-diacylglycerol--glycerol-3-phosphate-3-phosphatidyltransferase [Candidatus Mycoplasma haematominutum 'Birmingham 1']
MPNLLTSSRFFFGAFAALLYLLSIVLGDCKRIFISFSLVLLIISIVTDYLDGELARRWNCCSNFGKIYDPLADKLIVSSFLVLFSFSSVLHWIVPLFSVLREVITEWIRYQLKKIGVFLAAIKSAKYKTALQFGGLTIALFSSIWWTSSTFASLLFLPSLLLSFLSLSSYLSKYWEYY